MGTTLTGTTPQDTYDSLIKVTDNGPLSGSLKTLTDGLGNDSALALSTGAASITGTLTTSSITRAERLQVGTAASLNTPAGTGNTLQFANYSPSVFVTGSADSYIYKNSTVFGGLAAQSLVFQTRSDTTGGGFAFVAGGTPAVVATITGSGNVGIGTSAPAQKLEVNGAMRTTRSGVDSQYIQVDGGDAAGGFITMVGVAKTLTIRNNSTTASDVLFDQAVATRYTFAQAGTQILRIDADGVKFGTDSAAANALDDYEEGTFTPTNAGDATGAFGDQKGEYTKIGNVVHFRLVASISSNFTSNAIGGLPFTVGGSASPSGLSGNINVANDNAANLVAFIPVGGTSVTIYSDHNTNNPASPSTTMGILRMFGTYRV